MVCTVGLALILIVTELLLAGQAPLLIVHCNTFAPALNPVTEVVAELALVNVPAPLTTDQVPVPVAGVFAPRVAVVVVMYWTLPALETEGGVLTLTVIAVEVAEHLALLVTFAA